MYFGLYSLIFFFLYGILSATPIPEEQLKVNSGRMLFTLTKKTESGYDATMTKYVSMTGLANKFSGNIKLKEKTFDISMSINLINFFLSGEFKFANSRMHETHMNSAKFGTASYKGTIISYDPASGMAKVNGKLTVHGVTKDNFVIEGKVTKSKTGKGYALRSDFKVDLQDFKIPMPNTKLVEVNQLVDVKLKLELK